MSNEAGNIDNDRKLIEDLGGPTKLADILGYDKHGGVQRIQNWLSRGIPPKVKLQHPGIFLLPRVTASRVPSPTPGPDAEPDRPRRNPPSPEKMLTAGRT